MKISIVFAFFLYVIGLLPIIQWQIFWNQNEDLAKADYYTFKKLYIEHFPRFLQPLFSGYPSPSVIISVFIFIISGIIFIREKKIIFKVLGITSFLFAFFNLFSIM